MDSTGLLEVAWSFPLGLAVGLAGTLIGAGGGFILVPMLLFIHPEMSADIITSISLCVVFFNASSGTISYARMGRIDYRTGSILSLATVPGALIGALSTSFISRYTFHLVLGVLLLAVAFFLLARPGTSAPLKQAHTTPHKLTMTRTVKDAEGHTYNFSYNLGYSIALSVAVGYLSSLLGIGGGIIHVPVLVHLLNFPVHIATATSHFMLAIMALAGTIVHIMKGDLANHLALTAGLSLGVIAGAPLGAKLSNKLQGSWIIRGLAIALGLVGLRIIFL